jgi:hypothetical protein
MQPLLFSSCRRIDAQVEVLCKTLPVVGDLAHALINAKEFIFVP